jgi:hypothetical protein
MTKLPTPEQWAIVKMSEYELAEEIEKFIDYVDENGRSVHLPMQFVRHYMKRDDGALATIVAIAMLPIVLADGGTRSAESSSPSPRRSWRCCRAAKIARQVQSRRRWSF